MFDPEACHHRRGHGPLYRVEKVIEEIGYSGKLGCIMVLPGWNVTEPIHAAARFCQFVRKYRGASEEILDFASQVDALRQVLEAFDSCRKNPDSVDVEVRQRLDSASESCRRCAENCKAFVDRFFRHYEDAPAEIGPAAKLLWVWNKERALSLGANIQAQVNLINLHINLAEWQVLRIVASATITDKTRRNRQQSSQQLTQSSYSHATVQTPTPVPITPAALLGGLSVLTPPPSPALSGAFSLSPYEKRTQTYRALSIDGSLEDASTSSPPLSSNSSTNAPSITRRFSLPDYVPQVLGQGRDLGRTSHRWCPEMTMANLDGAFL